MKLKYNDLGALQIELMTKLWAAPVGLTVQDFLDGWEFATTPAYATVLVVLRRLERRGLVVHTVRGRTFVYTPNVTADAVRRAVATDLAIRFFGSTAAMTQFLQASPSCG